MKILSTAFKTNASGDTNAPLELYDLYLDNSTLRVVNYDKNIDFFDIDGSSQTYIGIPTSRESYERTTDNPINSIVLGISNVDLSMSAYLATHEFRGRRIIIRKVFADQLTSSGDVSIIFDGVMDSPAASEQSVQINAVDRIGTLKRKCPKRWYQLLCNNKFMDNCCSYGRTSGDMFQTARYVATTGCTISQIVSPSLTQSNEYWRDGDVTITSGQNALKRRKILLSSGDPYDLVKLDITLPYALESGDTFTIRRGCDKTWFRCSGDFTNDVNFMGFPTIPHEMVAR